MLHLGRDEQETQSYHFHHLSHLGMNLKAPRNPSDLKILSRNQVLPDLQGCHPKPPSGATEPEAYMGSWTEPSQMLRGIKASGERPGGSTRKMALCSQHSGMESALPGVGPPTWGAGGTSVGNPCLGPQQLVAYSPGATPGQDVGLSRPGAFKDLRILLSLRHEVVQHLHSGYSERMERLWMWGECGSDKGSSPQFSCTAVTAHHSRSGSLFCLASSHTWMSGRNCQDSFCRD